MNEAIRIAGANPRWDWATCEIHHKPVLGQPQGWLVNTHLLEMAIENHQ